MKQSLCRKNVELVNEILLEGLLPNYYSHYWIMSCWIKILLRQMSTCQRFEYNVSSGLD
jgi:hypothetical protein